MTKRLRLLTALAGIGAFVVSLTTITGATAHTDSAAATAHPRPQYREVRSLLPADAVPFRLSSPDVRNGGAFPSTFYANTFGCSGKNTQPRLTWSGAPAATKSYAVTMYDPDAPTGSGFWHWLTWDIPTTSHSTSTAAAPPPAVVGTHDGGGKGYLGPCPPQGDIRHRYEITVFALDVASLDLPAASTPAVVGFAMSGHIIGYGRITATARR